MPTGASVAAELSSEARFLAERARAFTTFRFVLSLLIVKAHLHRDAGGLLHRRVLVRVQSLGDRGLRHGALDALELLLRENLLRQFRIEANGGRDAHEVRARSETLL